MILHEKRKTHKKIYLKNFKKFFMAFIVLLYFLLRLPPFYSQARNKTYIGEYGKIEAIVSTEGIIVRDEEVIKHLGGGEILLLVKEGERVRKGQKIANIHFNHLDEKTTKDLEIINLRIDSIKDQQAGRQFFQKDIEKIENDILAITKEIQQYITSGNYEKVYKLKNELSLLIEKKSIIYGEKSFSGKNLEQLEQQKKSLEDKINASVEVVYSEYPGIIAMGSDGLEGLLTLKGLDDFSIQQYETLKNSIKSTNSDHDKDEELFLRIIKDHKWSIITTLKEKDVQDLKDGKVVKLRQRGDSKEYKTVVRKIIKNQEEAIVVLDLTEFMKDYYNKRVISFDLVKSSIEGIMIPNSAIIEKDNKLGVFRLDINGFARFVPIKVKGSNKEYSIVYSGYFDEDDHGEMKKVNTINYYDEIVEVANKTNEGDKIR